MTHEKVKRLSRGFAEEWLRPNDPDHATEALVDTLSTAMLAFHAVARGVELRAEALAPATPKCADCGAVEAERFTACDACWRKVFSVKAEALAPSPEKGQEPEDDLSRRGNQADRQLFQSSAPTAGGVTTPAPNHEDK